MFINAKTALLLFFPNTKLFLAVGYIVTVTHSLFTSPRNPSRFAGQRYISRHPPGCVYTVGWEAWSLTPSPWACGQLLSLLSALFYMSKSGFNHSYPFSKASNPHPLCTVTCGWSKSLTLNRAAAKSADCLCSHAAQKLTSLWGFVRSLCPLFPVCEMRRTAPQRLWWGQDKLLCVWPYRVSLSFSSTGNSETQHTITVGQTSLGFSFPCGINKGGHK